MAARNTRSQMVEVWQFKQGRNGAMTKIGTFPVIVRRVPALTRPTGAASGPIEQVKVEVADIDGRLYHLEQPMGNEEGSTLPRVLLPDDD